METVQSRCPIRTLLGEVVLKIERKCFIIDMNHVYQIVVEIVFGEDQCDPLVYLLVVFGEREANDVVSAACVPFQKELTSCASLCITLARLT